MHMTSLLKKALEHGRNGTLSTVVMRRLRWMLRGRSARYLDRARGVVHVGANTGQGCEMYALCGLPVVWIEPIPEVFAELQRNIAPYPDQRAVNALVGDEDGKAFRFNVASNGGGSSSIFEFQQHTDIWPDVRFERVIELESVTLGSLFQREGLDPSLYDLMVLDTQGSELLVLRGAKTLLAGFRQILAEAADFDAYTGGCKLDELRQFLDAHGFREAAKWRFATHPDGGGYFNVLFERAA